jgi:tetratricopeptide (TPR) repeat protein
VRIDSSVYTAAMRSWLRFVPVLLLAGCNASRETVDLATQGAVNPGTPPALRAAQAPTAAAPSSAAPSPPADGPPPLLFNDLGTYHHPVSCSAAAQQYFDQGLRLVYAFNHDEAVRAFNEAGRLDSNCAMAFWGVALALGPNINSPLDPERAAAAHAALQRAQALAPNADAAARDYIAALAVRYSDDPTADRKQLDRAYADAMRRLAHKYPDDPDASTLFAESLMDLWPLDLWTADGQPRPDTPEILATLEGVMQKDPNHPGANHYYIHAIEASPQPEKGAASAARLASLAPGAGHLVHMPSHIYFRTGRYAEAAEANRLAIAADERYIAAAHPTGIYPMMYYTHNIDFLWVSTSMEGRSAEAIQAARDVSSKASPEMVRQMPEAEFVLPKAYFALVRFGRWEEMLAQPAPAADLLYTTAMWHYARGLAFAATGRFADAARERAALVAVEAKLPAGMIVGDNQPASLLVRIASLTLAGEIAARQGQCETAIPKLEEAVSVQDGLPFSEPPGWYYPVRDSLGAVLLQCDRPQTAEDVYRQDLKRNPENGWALYGLAQALRAQDKTAEAAAVDTRFRTAWRNADVQLTSSRF